ncbi:uncharacterized protein LOC126839941 [Adelges cooleyi]|uniref:uncharacterized protein LOC126839941 n=1 Tax=Adelges cooleyi TaxID=133065 RepID=UPI0021802194|nr:uncharacterized protein LOC126839941 [Adelges cooleyi]
MERVLRPNLPVGPYRIKFKAVFICDEKVDYLIRLNIHQHKVSQTRVEMRGNISLKIPFDDSLNLNFNMAVLSKIGGWIDHAFDYSAQHACTTLKTFLGPSWSTYMRSWNMSATQQCPLDKGEYIMRYDLSDVNNYHIPKEFIYGTYKTRLYYTDKNGMIVGCTILVVDIVRPWE